MKKLITLLTVFCLCFTFAVQAAALKYGSKGSEVSTLQKNLNQLGYNLEVDGSFGPATKNAVLDFQRKYGLEVDGIAGPATQGKINELLRDYLKRGDTGPKVVELQNKLNRFGYGLDVDGSFGKNTENAVRDFQSRYGLKVDGIAGKETQSALNTIKPPSTGGGTGGGGSGGGRISIGNTNLVESNLSKITRLKQGPNQCKAASLALTVNIILGRNETTIDTFWDGSMCDGFSREESSKYKTIVGSDGHTYKATYLQDEYSSGSLSKLKSEIDTALESGLPIVAPVRVTNRWAPDNNDGTRTIHHWVTIVGKNGNDYKIIDPAFGIDTTLSLMGYELGLISYKDGSTKYGYVSFKKQ